LKKNSQRKDIPKPEIGSFYKNSQGHTFEVISVHEKAEFAVVLWVNEEFYSTWNYKAFPPWLERKLTPLEVELL
jgi:hypothetical protein